METTPKPKKNYFKILLLIDEYYASWRTKPINWQRYASLGLAIYESEEFKVLDNDPIARAGYNKSLLKGMNASVQFLKKYFNKLNNKKDKQ